MTAISNPHFQNNGRDISLSAVIDSYGTQRVNLGQISRNKTGLVFWPNNVRTGGENARLFAEQIIEDRADELNALLDAIDKGHA